MCSIAVASSLLFTFSNIIISIAIGLERVSKWENLYSIERTTNDANGHKYVGKSEYNGVLVANGEIEAKKNTIRNWNDNGWS